MSIPGVSTLMSVFVHKQHGFNLIYCEASFWGYFSGTYIRTYIHSAVLIAGYNFTLNINVPVHKINVPKQVLQLQSKRTPIMLKLRPNFFLNMKGKLLKFSVHNVTKSIFLQNNVFLLYRKLSILS